MSRELLWLNIFILLSRNLREEAIVVLDEESVPPKPDDQDSGLFTEVGSQKEGWPSLNPALVFCHLELLRVSLSPDLHLTQVSKLSTLYL